MNKPVDKPIAHCAPQKNDVPRDWRYSRAMPIGELVDGIMAGLKK